MRGEGVEKGDQILDKKKGGEGREEIEKRGEKY